MPGQYGWSQIWQWQRVVGNLGCGSLGGWGRCQLTGELSHLEVKGGDLGTELFNLCGRSGVWGGGCAGGLDLGPPGFLMANMAYGGVVIGF